MELFDIIQIIFTNPSKYSLLSNLEKRKYFFILNRRFAIQHPMQANALQHIKVNQVAVIDFWQNFLKKQYKGYIPKWIYTKGVKKTQEIKEKKLTINNDLINEYCKHYMIDRKSILDALKFFENETIKELKEFEKDIKK
jgi:hypothetical protein